VYSSDLKVMPDTYQMHIRKCGFERLSLLDGDAIAIFQFSDAPDSPAVEKLEDEHRVFPGDGVLPLPDILRDLKKTGFRGCISLELYNPDYWEQDLQLVAQKGLREMLAVTEEAGV